MAVAAVVHRARSPDLSQTHLRAVLSGNVPAVILDVPWRISLSAAVKPRVEAEVRRSLVNSAPCEAITESRPEVQGRHLDAEIIVLCARGDLGCKLPYRDLAEMMADRGICIAPRIILRWARSHAREWRWNRFARPVGGSWRMVETYVNCRGRAVGLVLAVGMAVAQPCAADNLSTGGMVGLPIMVAPEALFHTLASDFSVQPDGTTYVQTGDIPAMWLRDSAAQTLPYVRLARDRPRLKVRIRGVIERDAHNIAIDPYANAFRVDYRIWERKWEVDSLAYPVVLAWAYDDAFHDHKLFTPTLHRALARIVVTYDCESRHASCSHYKGPAGSRPPERGAAPVIGLIWSAFRPSDDATRFGYNVPGQMLATTALRDIADLAHKGFGDDALATRAGALADTISAAIARYAVVPDVACGGQIYAYEIDGIGGAVTYDDANLPSLLAAPLTGFLSIHDPIYQRTRSCLLTSSNRYFFHGRIASGIGSPHTPRGYVWPLALMSRALTSTDRREVLQQLQFLADSAGPGGRIRESFDPNDPARFTRAEFGWANAMYAELLFRAAADLPAQPVVETSGLMSHAMASSSIAVVDAPTALANRAALLKAFDRAVPSPLRR